MCTYTPEQKAAVMAALLTGQSVTRCSEEYNIPRGTIAKWSAKLDRSSGVSNTISSADEAKSIQTTKSQIGLLLLQYIEASIQTLIAQQSVFNDEKWLRLQPASELAVLHGVIADKTAKLLEAMASGDTAQNNE